MKLCSLPWRPPIQGELVYETEYSDSLLMFPLKAYDRDKFGDHIEAEAGSEGRHRGVARHGTDGGRRSRANRGVPKNGV